MSENTQMIAEPVVTPGAPGEPFIYTSWAAFVAAAALLFYAANLQTYVSTESSYSSVSGYIPAQSVSNIALLQTQMMMWQGGEVMLIVGVLLLSAGSIMNTIARRGVSVNSAESR